MKIEELEKIKEVFEKNPKKAIKSFVIIIIVSLFGTYLLSFLSEKGKRAASKVDQIERPYLDIEPDEIEYAEWSEKEKSEDPYITSRCDQVILYFRIHNISELPASNVDIKATSFIITEKDIGKFSPRHTNNSYEHNLHLITKEDFGRQPFILGLDKKATKYFKDGTIKVKIVVNVTYSDLNNKIKYWNEEAFLYSPTFSKFAKEIYSKGK